jgi:peroxiredoxin Q/BCP
MKWTCVLLAAAGYLAALLPASAADLKVGDPAPDFTMVGTDGKTHKLSDMKGKAVVVAWYPRAFTGGCTKECKSFKEQGAELRKYDVAYFTASTDDVKKNTDFAKSLDVDYVILSDPEGTAASAYGIYDPVKKFAKRVTFIIGPDGKILAIDSAVKTENHGQDVANKLKSLGIAEKK